MSDVLNYVVNYLPKAKKNMVQLDVFVRMPHRNKNRF